MSQEVTTSLVELEGRQGWGMANQALCRVLYPEHAEDVKAAFAIAREHGLTVHCWGNGRSYGDAALNEGNLLLDFSRMNRILDWDKDSGVVKAQPGITLNKLWETLLGDGYWVPVVTGTQFTTLGGVVAANAHGKNNHKYGPFGDHILAFELVSPDGELREVTRDSDPELFHAAIGGFGWLGVFVSITLQMKKVHSGRLKVLPLLEEDLEGMFRTFERCNAEDWDYVVGWIDAFPGGSALGRGQIHAARYYEEGEDPEGQSSFALDRQHLPDRFFLVIPKAWLWRFAKPFAHRWGMRLINLARFLWMKVGDNEVHPQEHARFNFLLDYVPNWKWIYKPGGLIQFQFFLPKDKARGVIRRALEMGQERKLESWLVVMKRHRPDPFWLSHAVDGYSFAMDFPVTDKNRQALWELTQDYGEMVVKAGGRFYFAKDATVSGNHVRRSLGDGILGRFFALKKKLDPQGLLMGSQLRRVFGDMVEELAAIGERDAAAEPPGEPTAPMSEAEAEAEVAGLPTELRDTKQPTSPTLAPPEATAAEEAAPSEASVDDEASSGEGAEDGALVEATATSEDEAASDEVSSTDDKEEVAK
ncbi:MAG: FAD-binding oxidoreductase [Deltaproteobacteria bacterium]|nr:MAG: FAD-binding oxidoreductase [Deltaproteobacteria bacterium]